MIQTGINPFYRAAWYQQGLWVLLMILSLPCCAGALSHELNAFFDSTGYAHQITDPTIYRDQQLGYYSGGSLVARRPVHNVELAQMQFPSVSSGCNGIDLFTGSFSVISGKELEHVAKDILSSASTYAFNLAIESMSPLVANVMEKLHSRMDMINQFGLNSCAMSAALVGGVWPRMQATQQQLCQDIGTGKPNVFSDWADARQGCGPRGDMQKTLSLAPKHHGFEERDLQGNLVWKALAKSSFSQQSRIIKEMLMSLSGTTVITIAADNTLNQQQYPSLIGSSHLISGLLHGGSVVLYHCDGHDAAEHCASISKMETVISPEEGLVARVQRTVSSITEAMAHDTPLSSEQLQFINSTPIPIAKIILVNLAQHPAHAMVDVRRFSDVIAVSMVMHYLNESLSLVNTVVNGLPVDKTVHEAFYQGLDKAFAQLRHEQTRTHRDMAVLQHVVDSARANEKLLAGRLMTQVEPLLQ